MRSFCSWLMPSFWRIVCSSGGVRVSVAPPWLRVAMPCASSAFKSLRMVTADTPSFSTRSVTCTEPCWVSMWRMDSRRWLVFRMVAGSVKMKISSLTDCRFGNDGDGRIAVAGARILRQQAADLVLDQGRRPRLQAALHHGGVLFRQMLAQQRQRNRQGVQVGQQLVDGGCHFRLAPVIAATVAQAVAAHQTLFFRRAQVMLDPVLRLGQHHVVEYLHQPRGGVRRQQFLL